MKYGTARGQTAVLRIMSDVEGMEYSELTGDLLNGLITQVTGIIHQPSRTLYIKELNRQKWIRSMNTTLFEVLKYPSGKKVKGGQEVLKPQPKKKTKKGR